MEKKCDSVFTATEAQCLTCGIGCDMRLVEFKFNRYLAFINPVVRQPRKSNKSIHMKKNPKELEILKQIFPTPSFILELELGLSASGNPLQKELPKITKITRAGSTLYVEYDCQPFASNYEPIEPEEPEEEIEIRPDEDEPEEEIDFRPEEPDEPLPPEFIKEFADVLEYLKYFVPYSKLYIPDYIESNEEEYERKEEE